MIEVTDLPDPIPLSALQHWRYCPRQFALIHVEQAFAENVYTLRGQAVHAKVDQPGPELRTGMRVERALPIWSDRLGLIGKADVVEFLPDGTPYPVEYKHGSRHKRTEIAACDDLQLAGQVLCLEEMTGYMINEAALYYARSRRRRVVAITPALREEVLIAIKAIRAIQAAGSLPPPVHDERCRACSLYDICQPGALSAQTSQIELLTKLYKADD